MKPIYLISAVFIFINLTSCRSYRSNLMFQLEDTTYGQIKSLADSAENNYKIGKNDYLTLEVYTNKGERIIDPDFELMENMQRGYMQDRGTQLYLVMDNGFVKLPMVGEVQVAGLSLYDAEKILEEQYNLFYNDVYVRLKYNNKRVVVLGALGGHVIPLQNENMNLLEVLALAGGIGDNGKSYNIRLIRGDLNNPQVEIVDLSTIEGMKKANLAVLPDDVVYVEPVRKTVSESLRDISPVLSLFTTAITLFVLIRSL